MFEIRGPCFTGGGNTTETVVSTSAGASLTNVGSYRHCSANPCGNIPFRSAISPTRVSTNVAVVGKNRLGVGPPLPPTCTVSPRTVSPLSSQSTCFRKTSPEDHGILPGKGHG